MYLIVERLVIAVCDGFEWEHQLYVIQEENLGWGSLSPSTEKKPQNLACGKTSVTDLWKDIDLISIKCKDLLKRPRIPAMMLGQ